MLVKPVHCSCIAHLLRAMFTLLTFPWGAQEAPPARSPACFVRRLGICANSSAEPTPRELRGRIC
eukprot:4718554-Alexandrium_andersonii.AAC.1